MSQSASLRESTFPMHRVNAKHGSIFITGPTTFDVTNGETIYQDLCVPDTGELHTILDVLDKSDWNEDQITAAVKALDEEEE